ncbi:hypothetical protein [Candidatus Neomicrothrix sp.]|nr:hypothetical protein [Candidatus Microthrix sp.]
MTTITVTANSVFGALHRPESRQLVTETQPDRFYVPGLRGAPRLVGDAP